MIRTAARPTLRAALQALALCLAAGAAVAQESDPRFVWPTYFRVGDLPPGETLTIRAEPNASSAERGAFKPGDGPIEVIATVRTGSTDWAEFIHQENSAFVALRFLEPVEMETIGETGVPVGLECGGTEPFWSVRFPSADRAIFDAIGHDGGPEQFYISEALSAQNRGGAPAWIALDGDDLTAKMTIDYGWCSDGMSDRDYAWRVVFLLESPERPLMQGCCMVRSPRD